MYELVQKLNRDDGITVIMISHDIQAALQYADKILHIGKSVFFGNRDEYLAKFGKAGFAQQGGADNG
jgi:zinc transport system ATP-binding protein